MTASRRSFLARAAAGGGMWANGGVPMLSGLSAVSAQEATVNPREVQLQPEIEPLVQLIEDTPRATLLEEIALRIRQGTSYREVLAALFLAGVRNVQPRPSVGFKFHAVLVVNSAHLASLSSPNQDRWLPIFWALDHFKGSQARDVREGNWTLSAVNESAVPSSTHAVSSFQLAMDGWDEEQADTAVAGLARNYGSQSLFELFARYGMRDFRSIGHKAIFVSNAFRTLNCIGWRHAEPVLRSLAYALLNHEGAPNPAQSDLEADRPWRQNQAIAQQIRPEWLDGRIDDGASLGLLDTLRHATPSDASQYVAGLLNDGISAQSVYDGLFLSAGEMLMRQPGIVALHASTTTNAMRYAFNTTGSDLTRRLLLLQNAAFLTMFREAMKKRGTVGSDRLDDLKPVDNFARGVQIQDIFRDLHEQPNHSARRMLGYLQSGGSAHHVIDQARRLVFLKGTDSHDYKFSSAVLEDFYHVSPRFRDYCLAASVFKLHGADEQDNGLVERIRTVLS